ncbi:MAG: efflux transporter outer membrane subunit [Caldithrix sp.]|nr:efflux transporter outer membrane subunit [Caldithrix sp.]
MHKITSKNFNSALHFGKMPFVFTILSMVIINACATRTRNIALEFTPPEQFSITGEQKMTDQWWTAFQDSSLNALVDQTVQSNFTVKSAWQRLLAARASANRDKANLFPDLDISANGQAQRTSEGETEQISLGLSSSYELDVWGKIPAGVKAERLRAEATLADYRTMAITLSAEVVRTYFRLIEANSQKKLLIRQIDTNQKLLNLIKNRFGSGQIRSVDILRQRQLLESTYEQKITEESRIQVLKNRLEVLMAKPPRQKINITRDRLPPLPQTPESGVPAELVGRRPDVKAAYKRLLAADRDLAVAITNQLPRLDLSASLSTTAENAGNLFDYWVSSIAGDLLAPVFYGGRLRAEVDRRQALKKQRLYEYEQSILNAFQEVEDALIREKKQLQRIQSLEEQVRLARLTSEQLRVEYLNGLSDYLDVLTAFNDEQRLRRNLLAAKLVLLEYRVQLYRALAGRIADKRDRIPKGK